MTTSVRIDTHCEAHQEVKVKLVNKVGKVMEEFTLQNGEKLEGLVYEGQSVTVEEVAKSV
jgi:hypothetical protein